ncbi:MAG: M48 family metalloprotease [Armatimonadota bacterium]|nr:M48 family metalloprotease [Armatimonadota bacterium]
MTRVRSSCFALLVVVFCLAPGARRCLAAPIPLEQELEAGRGFVNAFVAQYGLSENARYRQLAETVLSRITKASGERPELQWRAVVLKYNPNNPVGRNASAWPGGHLVTDEKFIEMLEAAAGGDPARTEALLAGVVAHEIAHVIRRDTDALVPLFFQGKAVNAQQLLFTLKSTDSPNKTNATEQRTKENECDRHGAFYLLRAGYDIKDMIDVFRKLAEEEVDEVLFNSELDHARANERVGNLLEVRGQVQVDEQLYDEAVNILRAGLEELLPVADQNLQQVALRFPTVLPVRHARAALAHRRYIAKVPPEKLVFKPSFSFYRFRPTRSLPEDYLQEAIALYEGILKDYESQGYRGLGPTAAAYALALTHARRINEALTWAQRAVELAPEDWNSYNVLGIALYLSGMKTEAVEQFRKAVALAAPPAPRGLVERSLMTATMEERAAWGYVASLGPVEFGPALFNLGVASQAAGQKGEAVSAFQAYLATDARSSWADRARALMKELGVATPPGLPSVAGVSVGMADVEVSKKLGQQRGIAPVEPGGQAWRYKEKGFTLFLDEGNRVRAGLLYQGFPGEVGPGVRVGTPAAQVEKVWGKPVSVAEAGDRQAWVYPAQGLTFVLKKGVVSRVLWAPAPAVGSALVRADVRVSPGDKAEKVKEALGPPDAGLGDEQRGGVWTYNRLGVRVRFDPTGVVALVTITNPSTASVGGIRLGDSAAKVRQVIGPAFASEGGDAGETLSYPDRGVAFVMRNAAVAVINLFPRQV